MFKPHGKITVWNLALLGLVALAATGMVLVVLKTDIFGGRGSGLPKAFTLDANEIRPVDPNLVIYRELGDAKIPTGMKEPMGIALADDGRVFVAGDREVRVFAPDAKLVEKFPVAGGARCIALGGKDGGTMFVGVDDHVEVLDSRGQRVAAWPAPADASLVTCVTVADDNVLACFYRKRAGTVIRYDRAGKLLNKIVSRDEANNPEPFTTPSTHLDAVESPDGLVRIANPGKLRVEAYTMDGQVQRQMFWGKPSAATPRGIEGFMPCCNPTDLAMLPDGGFVTSEKGVPRVKVYDPAGNFAGVVATPDDFVTNDAGMDLAVDKQGRIFVLDPMAKAVRVFVSKARPAK